MSYEGNIGDCNDGVCQLGAVATTAKTAKAPAGLAPATGGLPANHGMVRLGNDAGFPVQFEVRKAITPIGRRPPVVWSGTIPARGIASKVLPQGLYSVNTLAEWSHQFQVHAGRVTTLD